MLHKPQPLRLSGKIALLFLVTVAALIGSKILAPLPSSPAEVSRASEDGSAAAAQTESPAAEQVSTPNDRARSKQNLSQETQAANADKYGSLPLSFEVNRGQTKW
ncbi:MAG: hypothetical protein ACR2H6_08035 [Pyrinomonadaceae bacterium]